jgi:prepilin-type N-terminal cleavage/methylation domain-containing protein
MKTKMFKKGFTLIELLIVIAIIGILAVALLPNVLNAPVRARDAARKSDIATIVKAVETYNVDNGGYPAAFCTTDNYLPSSLSNYFSGGKAPKDPGAADRIIIGGCKGGYYFCKKNGKPFNYLVIAKMENTANNNSAAPNVNDNDCKGSSSATFTGIDSGTDNYVVAQ